MNYRHAFHAGNFADVLKHAVVVRIVEYLKRKEKPFRVIDTHAGAGLYDLDADAATRTGEWRDGIGRLFEAGLTGEAEALLSPYVEAVRALNPDGGLRFYPGSPALVRHLLRRQDRLTAIELHPEDADRLASAFAGDHQLRVIRLDGWLALRAHLPPKERRGLVLVDPPFEEPGEFDRMIDGLVRAHRRWPGGTYALWYPLKDRAAVAAFERAVAATAIPDILAVRLEVRAPSALPRLDGSCMIVVNPPYTLPDELRIILPALRAALAQAPDASWSMNWLTAQQRTA